MTTLRDRRPWATTWVVAATSLALVGAGAPLARANPGDPPPNVTHVATGVVPDGMDWSAVNDTDYPIWPLARVTPKFDLRTESAVPPVRDQGPHGSCWTFAATGSAMSGLTRQGQGAAKLSPAHLVYAVYNPLGITGWTAPTGAHLVAHPLDDGGNDLLAASAWAKRYGAQTEAAYPYSRATAPVPLSQVATSAYHQRDAWVFPRVFDGQGRFNEDNLNAIKDALFTLGALSVSYHADYGQTEEVKSTVYEPSRAAVYNPPNNPRNPTNAANHAALVIGWDDTFPAAGFSTRAPGNGAWLVQNSWGSQAGAGGYFWLSYFDATATQPWFYNLVPAATDLKNLYFLDDGPPTTRLSLSGRTGYGANVFTVPGDGPAQSLKAVSVFFGAPMTGFAVSVYRNPTTNPTSGTLADVSAGAGTAVSGEVPDAGWNRIDLDRPVTLQPGDRFAVVVQLTAPSGSVTFFQESARPMRSQDSHQIVWSAQARVTSQAGQSFLSGNGSSWTDTGASGQGNLAIQALADDAVTVDYSALLQPLLRLLAAFLAQMYAVFGL